MIFMLNEWEDVPDENLGIVMICILAIFVYCTIFIFFYDRILGFVVTLISKGVLDTNTYFKVQSISIAPLSCRIFFKGVLFQNEDILCRIVDGYITLSFMYGQPRYIKLHEDMISADLVQMRCQVESTLRRDKGVIVAVDIEKKKVCVCMNAEDSIIDLSDDENVLETDDAAPSSSKTPTIPTGHEYWEEELENIQHPESGMSAQGSRFKTFVKPPVNSHSTGEQGCSNGHVKWYNYSDILLPQKYSRCRCHLNGLQVSIYNSTGRYTELAAAAEELRGETMGNEETRSNFLNALKEKVKSTMRMKKGPTASEEEVALSLQKDQLNSKTLLHQFFDFVKSIEVDIAAASFSIGGAKSDFPFFVHTTCKRFSGSCYRTRSGCNPVDLYRSVYDFSMENVDVRVSKMQPESVDISEKPEIADSESKKLFESLDDFSLIIDGSSKNAIHFRFYLDAPNIFAGEKITRESVPRSGLEVVLDIPRVRVSPWIEYCRGHLFEFFFPQTYLPLKPLEFKIGEPRPRAPLDVVVTFAKTMTAEVVFKRKSPTIGPPFGMVDSTEVGCIISKIGTGSEYIQRGAFLLEKEKNQCLKILFSGKDLEVQCNAVLGLSCTLAKADSVQCYLDRVEEVIWNKCKMWNFTLAISKGQFNFNMSYISFFMDLLNDWQFANAMYLGDPLSTETFNTKTRFIKEFIPQVRKFELIVDNGMNVFLNNNHQNVIYAKDPFSRKENVLAHLRIASASFEMELPSDQYLLSCRNEITRPFRGIAKNACAFLLLPPSHPYHHSVKDNVPFASVKSFEVAASFTSQCGNQSIPQSTRTPSPFHQHLDLEITISEVRGDVRGCHIKGVWDFLENNFIDHTCSITPKELFWLFSLLQSKVAFGKNKKKEWNDFLESKYPTQSFMESSISVTLKDIEVMIAKPEETSPFPYLELRTPEFNFSCLKEEAAMEVNVNLTPIIGRFREEPNEDLYKGASSTILDETIKVQLNGGNCSNSFLCVGSLVFSFIKHCGPLPSRYKVHQLLKLQIDGVVFDISSHNLLRLVEILLSLKNEVFSEDKTLEEYIYRARVEAERNLSTQIHVGESSKRDHLNDGLQYIVSSSHTIWNQSEKELPAYQTDGSSGVLHATHDSNEVMPSDGLPQDVHEESSSHEDHPIIIMPNILSLALETVPLSLAKRFVEFLAQEENNEYMFKEYGLEFINICVPHISGVIRFSSTDLFWIEARQGLTVESSSLNTLFATKQLSLRVPEITLKGMRHAGVICQPQILMDALTKEFKTSSRINNGISVSSGRSPDYSRRENESEEQHLVEVFHCCTGITVSHKTESSVDGGLKQHLQKQREFIEKSNYQKMMHEQIVHPNCCVEESLVQRSPVVKTKILGEEKIADDNQKTPSPNGVNQLYSYESPKDIPHGTLNGIKTERKTDTEEDKAYKDGSPPISDIDVAKKNHSNATAYTLSPRMGSVPTQLTETNDMDRSSNKTVNQARYEDRLTKESQLSRAGTTEVQSSRNFFSCISCSSLDSFHSVREEAEESLITNASGKDEPPAVIGEIQPRAKLKENPQGLFSQNICFSSHLDATPLSTGRVKSVPQSSAESESYTKESTMSNASFSVQTEIAECPYWRYYSFYTQERNNLFINSLDYNPHVFTSNRYHDKSAFNAPLPIVSFSAVLPSIGLDEPYIPISQHFEELESIGGGESIVFTKKNSGGFEMPKGVGSNESFVKENGRVAGGQHIIREHIMVESECTSILIAAEVCPLLGRVVNFGNSCATIVEDQMCSMENNKNSSIPNTLVETTVTVPARRAIGSSRVFYKTRKPVVLYVVHAKIPKFSVDVIGKRQNEEMVKCRKASEGKQRKLSEDALLRLFLSAHEINFSLQQRPDTSTRNVNSTDSKAQGQSLTIVLKYGSIVVVSSVEGESTERGTVDIDIPCFHRQLTPRCIAGVTYAGKGSAMICIHTFPFHVILSPISLGAIGVHLTKDFSDALLMLKAIIEEIQNICDAKYNQKKTDKSWLPPSPEDDNDALSQNDSPVDGRRGSSSSSSPVRHDVISFDHGRTQIEGKIFLEKVTIVLYDIVIQNDVLPDTGEHNNKRKRKRMWVMNRDLNSFNIGTSYFNFSAKMEKNYTFTKTAVHAVGNVGQISVKVFPNVVYVLSSFLPLADSSSRIDVEDSTLCIVPDTNIGDDRHAESLELNVSCRLNNLEADIMEKDKNLLRLRVHDVAFSHSTHSDEFRSIPDLDVNQFSLFIKTRLCFLAIRSKLHVLNSSRTAMCSLSVRSQLKSTTSLSFSDLSATYLPDMKWDENSKPNVFAREDCIQEALKVGVQSMNIAVHSCFAPEVLTQQFNVSICVSEIFINLPYIPHFSDVIYPQLQHFVFSWRTAFFESSDFVHSNPQSTNSKDFLSSVYPWAHNINSVASNNEFYPASIGKAAWLIVRLECIHLRVGLDDDDTQEFLFPCVHTFFQASEERWNLKVHVHPSFAFSESHKRRDYELRLPDVYVLFNGDEMKMSVLSVIGKLSANITTLMVHHSTLALQKVLEEIVPLFKPIPLEQRPICEMTPLERKMVNLNLIRKVKYRKQAIDVLFCGGRLSYLAKLCAIRFSIQCFRLHGESEPENRRNQINWNASVDNLQVALTDSKIMHHHKKSSGNVNSFSAHDVAHSPELRSAFSESRGHHSFSKSIDSLSSDDAELIGFVWGALTLSFNLSNEMVNEQKGLDAFINTSFSAHTSDVRNYILNKVGESVNRWDINLKSPVAILRFGFYEILLQTLRDTKDNLDILSNASTNNKMRSLAVLQKIEKFRMYQNQKNNIFHLIEEADKEHKQHIEDAERQVAQELSSRVLLTLKSRDLKNFWSNVRSYSKHICSGTISHISVIIPVGDAAYRRVADDIYSLTKAENNELGLKCILDRKMFQPHFAIKLQIERVCLLFSLSKTDTSFQSMIHEASKALESSAATLNKGAMDVSSTTVVNGRIALNSMRIFMTDGTSLEVAPPDIYQSALSEVVIFGGKGILSLLRQEEFRLSRNCISISSIGMPFNIRKVDAINCRTVMDISSPEVHCSPWILPLMADVLEEFPKSKHSHPFSKTPGTSQLKKNRGNIPSPATSIPNIAVTSGAEGGKNVAIGTIPMSVDVSARLDKGKILFFSHTFSEEVYQAPQVSRPSKFDRVRADNNGKTLPHKNHEHRADHQKSAGFSTLEYSVDHNSDQMVPFPSIPLPSAVLQISVRRDTEEENRVVRAEVNVGEICLSPNMLMIEDEIQGCLDKFDWIKNQRSINLVKSMEEIPLEEGIKRKLRYLKCTIIDVLLPTPYVYTTASRVQRFHSSNVQDDIVFSEDNETPGALLRTNTVIHCSIQHFRLVFDTSPIHTTSCSFYLSDQGSIDILLNMQRTSNRLTRLTPPESSLIFHVHQLRAECQTRLEVKSVEVYCPELTFLLGQRKKNDHEVLTISLNLPFSVDTSEQNVLIRFQHLAQLFILLKIWEKSIKDFSSAVSQSFVCKTESFASSAQWQKESLARPLTLSGVAGKNVVQKNINKMIAISVSSGWFEVDLGGGNLHKLSSGSLKVSVQLSNSHGGLTHLKACRMSLRDVIIKSEGLLSGSSRMNEALLLLYIIENASHGSLFVRTKEGRTFRFFLQAKGLSSSYKERHVKDVLEFKSDLLKATATDGINVDDYALLDINIDVNSAKLRINPSTMPAFLNLVYSLSVSFHSRRELAMEKIKSASQSKQFPPYILHHISAIKPNHDEADTHSISESEIPLRAFIPFMGSKLEKIPCGQLQLSIANIMFILGGSSAEESNYGTVVAHAPFARICFAECTTANYRAAKRVLQITSENVEIFRPLPSKSLIIGLKGTNILEFYTNQRIGEREVGFTLDLTQDHPWTGNPIYRDFAEIVELINNFIDNSNIEVLKKLMNGDFQSSYNDDSQDVVTPSKKMDTQSSLLDFPRSSTVLTDQLAAKAELKRELDPRIFKPLRPAKFSPQLRFGGDISVNTEVILNWLGVTEKVLPRAIHCAIGDKLEEILDHLMKMILQKKPTTPSLPMNS